MNTEITDNNAENPVGWVFYDGECAFCLGWVRRMERTMVRRGFKFATLQSRRQRSQDYAEMILELPDGNELGGADAAMEIARHIWWLWPVWFVSRIPGAMPVFRAGYQRIAQHRHCLGGRCESRNSTISRRRHTVFFEMP